MLKSVCAAAVDDLAGVESAAATKEVLVGEFVHFADWCRNSAVLQELPNQNTTKKLADGLPPAATVYFSGANQPQKRVRGEKRLAWVQNLQPRVHNEDPQRADGAVVQGSRPVQARDVEHAQVHIVHQLRVRDVF